jgi:hypothetical protein
LWLTLRIYSFRSKWYGSRTRTDLIDSTGKSLRVALRRIASGLGASYRQNSPLSVVAHVRVQPRDLAPVPLEDSPAELGEVAVDVPAFAKRSLDEVAWHVSTVRAKPRRYIGGTA